ncbi:MAG: hypothetical protein ACE5DQ_03110, partial [Candidatus Paceibacterota bacterium]
MAGGSSISVPLTLPQPDAIVDSYTDGRGNALQLITNRYGSGTSYTDAIGNRTLVQRNKHNQISRIDYPNNAYQEYFYDSDNLLTDLSHSEGMSTSYTYDSLFRPININSSFSPDLNLTYDAQYNVTQLVIGAD